MSKLDEYKKAQEEHDILCRLIADTKPAVVRVIVSNDGHDVHFHFVSTEDGNIYQCSGWLATMLAKACALKLREIIAETLKFSEAELFEKVCAARAEAIETLQTIKVEKGVSNA